MWWNTRWHSYSSLQDESVCLWMSSFIIATNSNECKTCGVQIQYIHVWHKCILLSCLSAIPICQEAIQRELVRRKFHLYDHKAKRTSITITLTNHVRLLSCACALLGTTSTWGYNLKKDTEKDEAVLEKCIALDSHSGRHCSAQSSLHTSSNQRDVS